jgi:hypothetical protein
VYQYIKKKRVKKSYNNPRFFLLLRKEKTTNTPPTPTPTPTPSPTPTHTNLKEQVHFWPSNFYPSLVLTIEPQNQKSSTIELLKPFIFYHLAVLAGGFADMAATWRRVHMSASSLSSLFSSLPPPPLSRETKDNGGCGGIAMHGWER